MCVSLLTPECDVSLCVRVCMYVILQIRVPATNKKNTQQYVLDLSKLGKYLKYTHQGPSGTKVAGLDMCRSIIPLRKIAHQMWRDHPFSQRN